MLVCPNCDVRLHKADLPNRRDFIHHCARCRGKAIGFATFRHIFGSDPLNAVLRDFQSNQKATGKRCPSCTSPTHQFLTQALSPYGAEIDLCSRCNLIWFDAGELNKTHRPTETIAASLPLSHLSSRDRQRAILPA